MTRDALLDARILALVDNLRDVREKVDALPSIEANSSTERCVRIMEGDVADLFDQCQRLRDYSGTPPSLGSTGA